MIKNTFYSLIFLLGSTNVWAAADSSWGYDDIVEQLSQPTTRSKAYSRSEDPFAYVKLHAGVGFITSNITVIPTKNDEFSSFLRGVEASLAVDLFHENWAAEGAVRAFGTQRNDEGEYSLKEFDLKLIYRDYITYKVKWKAGLGVAARYLNFTDLDSPNSQAESDAFATSKNYKYTTPASILFLGIEGYLTNTLSLGAEIGYRNAMIDETADKSTIEASLKLETHF